MGGGGQEKVEERRKVERRKGRKMREGRRRGRESMGELKEDEGGRGVGEEGRQEGPLIWQLLSAPGGLPFAEEGI